MARYCIDCGEEKESDFGLRCRSCAVKDAWNRGVYGDKILSDRFWEKVDVRGENECWPWIASSLPSGYGQIWIDNRLVLAHRVAWMLEHGPIPTGMCVCHKCDNPPCCNPHHLFLGTRSDNMKDMTRKGRGNPGANPAKGEDCPASKLSWEQVREIRKKYKAGGITQRVLAYQYGISPGTINYIINNKTWKEEPPQ